MARPWYSFYPADYGRDTGHLTLVEHGAYRLLIDHYYATAAPLPADEARLMRICRVKTRTEKRAVRHVLDAFFRAGEDGWRHKRIDAEILKAADHLAASSFGGKLSAARRAARRKASDLPSDGPSDGPSEIQPSQSQPQSQKTDSFFEEFWSAFPRKEARGAALTAWARAVELAPPEILVAAARAYATRRAGQDEKYTRAPASWLTQQCWLDDAPVVADAAHAVEVARAWDGDAAPLVAEIGAAAFTAYFAGAEFSRGPPALIRVGKPHLAALIARRYSGALGRAYGEYSLEGA